MTRWHRALSKKYGIPDKTHKYGAEKESTDGYSFASALERVRYQELKLLMRAGEISDLQVQDHIELSAAKIKYIADFKYFDTNLNQYVWDETKGYETPEWRLKRRLWIAYGPGLLRIHKGTKLGTFLHEELWGKNIKD